MKFEGIYTPVITPYKEDGSIDRDAFCVMVESLVSAGVQGVINGGSTGEYYAQSMDERLELAKLAKDVIGKRTASLSAQVQSVFRIQFKLQNMQQRLVPMRFL